MKLDVNALRYLSREDFRVLTAVEMGQKNHEIVPVDLITTIAGLKHGGTYRHLKTLLRFKLLHHDSSKYDGYRLTYMGYDFLAIRTLLARGHISAVGRRIGVGKESDVFEVRNEEGEVMALKLHRLGRTSFRAVKSKRDYMRNKNSSSFSWLYLSRLAALKEYAFMAALEQRGMPVPRAVDHNRHAVLMSLVEAYPLTQVRELRNPGEVYTKLLDFMERLAGLGLVHCDFNEFNVMVDDDDEITIIDFPQMVSVAHPNAADLFERDADGVMRFFKKKLGYMPEHDESIPRARPSFEASLAGVDHKKGLDVELAASGFKEHHQQALESYLAAAAEAGQGVGSGSESDAGSDYSDSTREEADASADRADQLSEPLDVVEPLDAVERLPRGQAAEEVVLRSPTSDADSAPDSAYAADSGVAIHNSAAVAAAELAGSRDSVGAVGRDGVEYNDDSGGSGVAPSSADEGEEWDTAAASGTVAGSTAGAARTSRSRRHETALQDVQRRVTAGRQSNRRKAVMAQAGRNAQKRTSIRKRNAVNDSARLG